MAVIDTAWDISSPSKLDHQDVLVMGVGNPLMGDDGVGKHIIELLAEHLLPPNVKIENAGLPGWELPAWLEGWSNVILVDAIQMGESPGSWRRLLPEQMRLEMEHDAFSLHQPDLACGLALAEALDILPENLILYGIEPAAVNPGETLSAAVRLSLPDVVASILDDLEKIKV